MDPEAMQETMSDAMEAGVELLSTWGLQVVGAIAVLIIGRWVAGAIRKGVVRALTRSGTDASLIPFVSGIAYYLALAVVLIAVLNLFGIETTSLVAVLGAAGLAVGLALQGTLSNFSSGVMLLIFRPFKNGDVVEAAGVKGGVAEIGIFSTTINTPDNVKIIVPNSAIFGSTISNYTAYDTRRNDLVMGIGYNDDIDLAIETIKRVVTADERSMTDPEPAFFVGNLGESSVDITIRVWCKTSDYWGLRADLNKALKEEIERAGLSIPYPQRDLHVIDMPSGTN